nr:DNA helicase [Tanacetum cinerariifolium]
MHPLSTESEIKKKARIGNEISSDNGVYGSLSPFVSSVSRPCKPLLNGGYRSPQSNYSVGGKVVVLDFGNSEVRLESCESFFGVNHSEGSRHSVYEFPNDSPFPGSYIRSGPMVLDFENYVTPSVGAGNELRRTDAHKSTPSTGFKVSGSYSVGDQCRDYFRQCGILCSPGECSFGGTSGTCKCTPVSLPTDENGRGTNRMRSSSVGSGHHEAANDVNHGGHFMRPRTDSSPMTFWSFILDFLVLLGNANKICQLQWVNKLHPSYMSLQFPLLFVYGEPGFYPQMKQRQGVDKRLSMNQYYMFQLHERLDYYALLFRGGRLFQQYVVGVFCSIEKNRLDFYRLRQNDIRLEYLSGVHDAISRGDREGSQVGGRLILPRTFTRGPRYMYSHYLDAFAICRVLGNPQYFVTFTCNVNWPEIKGYILQFLELTFTDRADIVVRVFQQKVNDFCTFLKDRQVFGSVTGQTWASSLSHSGLGGFKDKIQNASQVDRYISVELLDPDTDPEGYRVVSEMMVHGPCGLLHSDAVCLKEGKCGKNFLKKFIAHTFFDTDGYVRYRKRETHTRTSRRGVDLDNGYIVPYNRQLCLAFHAHINVEYCGWSMLIKYLFKYISKGTDKIAAKIARQVGDPPADTNNRFIQIDEIQNYIDGRFVCPHEACWRIIKYDIHDRQPAVQILSIHLEGMQPVTFRDHQHLTLIVNNEAKTKTTLTEWLKYKKRNGDGLHLTYIDFTKEFVWYSDTKTWLRRQRRNSACEALGLLGDDKEWHIALEEAAFLASSQQLRSLFVQILIFCDVADPLRLWKAFWRRMSDDVPRTVSNSLHIQDLYMNDPELEGSVLYEVEVILKNYSKTVVDFGMSPLSPKCKDALKNRELMEEKSYNRAELAKEVAISVPKLNSDQKAIYDMVLRAANENKQEMIFVYSHDGIEKTFLWRTLINNMRSEGKIGLAVASLGIVSLLLPAVHTTHSRFKLPLDLTDESLCNIKKNTNAESLLAKTSLIIWDESPMNDRRYFEALDRTLRDVLDAHEKLFGGKTIVHGENMRLQQPGLNKYEKTRAANFVSWLLEIGDGKTGTVEENNDGDSSWITVPKEFCIPDDDNGLKNLIGFIYDENTLQHPTAVDLQQKAIVCPKNTTADEINKTVLEMLHGKSMVYISSDEAIPVGSDHGEVELLYPPAGDVVEVTLWDKMATEFNREEFEKIEQHVTFAISSCKANIYGGIQLSGTPTTHYYFNLEIPRLEELREQQRLTLHPPLQISKEIHSDINAEKNRNKFPFSTLLQQNPDGYRVYDKNGEAYCVNHGLQKPPTYRYIFKALLTDQSATASVTFFTPNADVLIGSSCTELVKKYGVPNPREFPDEILSLNGRTHIFQVHNNPSCIQGRVDYYFDDILDKQLQIARPSQSSEPSIVTPLPIIPETPGTPAEQPA